MTVNIDLIFKTLFFISLIVISIIDFKKLYIPNFYTFTLLVMGLLYNWLYKDNIISSILGIALYSIPFSLIYGYLSDFLNKEVLGYGDVKLSMGIGACLGFTSFENIYFFFLYSFVIGSVYAVYLLIKIKKRDVQLPFGPFISISGCIMMLFY